MSSPRKKTDLPSLWLNRILALIWLLLITQAPLHAAPSFNETFDRHASVMLLIDPKNGAIVDANDAAATFYGYSREKMRSMRIQQINMLTPEQVKAERKLAVQESRNYFVFRHQIANGEIKTVEVFSNPLNFSGRTLLHSIIVDISAKRTLKEAVLRQQQQLEQTIAEQTEVIAKDYRKRTLMLIAVLICALGALVSVLLARKREKRLHKNLRIEQQRLENVINGTQAGTWEWDLNSKQLHVNERWAQLIGYSLEELTPITASRWFELIHPGDLELAKRSIEEHINDERDFFTCEIRVQHKKGYWLWIMDRGRVTKWSATGEPLTVSGTRQDTSERKQAEAELVASNKRYLSLTTNIPDGTYSLFFDTQGETHFEYVSPRFCQILKVDAETVLQDAKAALSRVHPEDITSLMATSQSARSGLKPFRWEGRFVIDEEVRWMRIASNPAPIQDGRVVWVGVISDITEAKRTALSLNLASQVFRNAREGMMITDLNNKIIDVNNAFTDITGYMREDVIAQDPGLLSSGRHSDQYFADMWQKLQAEHYWSGEFWNRRKSGELYMQRTSISAVFDDNDELREYLSIFSDVTQERSHETELQRIAHFDSLTGLPNRMLLADRLSQAMKHSVREKKKVAVLYVDLDKFKEVNDTHGHDVGDELLIHVSQAMNQCLRDGDTLARIGGDEFIAVLPDGDCDASYTNVINRLLTAATAPIKIRDLDIKVTASIGVTLYPQTEVVEADQLMRQADQAMYQAKVRGKNRVHFFDVEEDIAARDQHASAEQLSKALGNNEFELFYQPKVDMQQGHVMGMEALLRWRHPVLGVIPPGLFLPSIENDELVVDIGDWVISQALQQLAEWKASGCALNISVNIAAKQLQSSEFTSTVKQQIDQTPGYNHGDLTLEILEHTAIDDLDAVSATLKECVDAGVNISLDDFGTGYSSLTYLSRLNANEIKIDRSFVQDMLTNQENQRILAGVIALANTFKLPAIAEGVESVEHGTMLIELGCRYAQGYAIARPMPAAEVIHWVHSWAAPDEWQRPQSEVQGESQLATTGITS